MSAPVILFVYNRPEHTRSTLESLSANAGAGETDLYIHCDGAKAEASEQERECVRQVRSIIREKPWCGRVTIIESETNRGLGPSIVQGVREVLARHGSVIVLEDDLLLAPGFLRYMNDALRCYENDDEVMHVSGYMFPVKAELPETFFLRLTSSWGWATWQRAFAKYEPDAGKSLERLEQQNLLGTFNLDGAYDYVAQLRANAAGRLQTWAVRWYASLLLNGGLGLFPRQTLVKNIGFDGTGTHCDDPDQRFAGSTAGDIHVTRTALLESATARNAVRRILREPLGQRLRRDFRRGWKQLTGMVSRKA